MCRRAAWIRGEISCGCGWKNGRSNTAYAMQLESSRRLAIKYSSCRIITVEGPTQSSANFHPAASGSLDKGGPLTVLWIANLKPWKRPGAFVRLAQRLATCRQVRFVMIGAPAAGSGNQSWQRALMHSIESTPNLEYRGQKSHEEVNELLDRSHILVNTSTHEGFPNTFIQAWLRAVAVVSLQVDPDQVLKQQHLGIAAQSEESLVEAVRELIENADARADFALRGLEHATANHSLRNVGDLLQVIDSCATGTAYLPVDG